MGVIQAFEFGIGLGASGDRGYKISFSICHASGQTILLVTVTGVILIIIWLVGYSLIECSESSINAGVFVAVRLVVAGK